MIITHSVYLYGLELNLTVEVENIEYGNDGIGWYQRGSQWSYDKRDNYVEGFEIGDIYIDTFTGTKLVDNKSKGYRKLCSMLYGDDSLYEKIMDASQEYANDLKAERQIEAWEYAREAKQNGGLGR
jgi:hypothetical protein